MNPELSRDLDHFVVIDEQGNRFTYTAPGPLDALEQHYITQTPGYAVVSVSRHMPRIDIIHTRNPDYECHHEVYVDGQGVNAEYWDFDPGAGYTMEDFEADRQSHIDAAPEFLKERVAAIYEEMRPIYRRWSL